MWISFSQFICPLLSLSTVHSFTVSLYLSLSNSLYRFFFFLVSDFHKLNFFIAHFFLEFYSKLISLFYFTTQSAPSRYRFESKCICAPFECLCACFVGFCLCVCVCGQWALTQWAISMDEIARTFLMILVHLMYNVCFAHDFQLFMFGRVVYGSTFIEKVSNGIFALNVIRLTF